MLSVLRTFLHDTHEHKYTQTQHTQRHRNKLSIWFHSESMRWAALCRLYPTKICLPYISASISKCTCSFLALALTLSLFSVTLSISPPRSLSCVHFYLPLKFSVKDFSFTTQNSHIGLACLHWHDFHHCAKDFAAA